VSLFSPGSVQILQLSSVSSKKEQCIRITSVFFLVSFFSNDLMQRKAENTCTFIQLFYTGCNRRNGLDFGKVFLRSNYTDITQNTYIQSSMVKEILAIEKCGILWCLRTVLYP